MAFCFPYLKNDEAIIAKDFLIYKDKGGSVLAKGLGRCGGISHLSSIFFLFHDVVAGKAMIVGYMQNGFNEEAIDLFRSMIQMRP
ncbi:hypothetical protein OSB04_026264 [Centaurea solstitialis]|uniref:Pentatricopeptide repeat-containing protein n=1 Tax=Centaurea solstitialis TaxID=347529 RepID=A0AA38SCD5_9ASTR|nr:hypothetical protein OSB04_026264 [Centaurea solstitialis]